MLFRNSVETIPRNPTQGQGYLDRVLSSFAISFFLTYLYYQRFFLYAIWAIKSRDFLPCITPSSYRPHNSITVASHSRPRWRPAMKNSSSVRSNHRSLLRSSLRIPVRLASSDAACRASVSRSVKSPAVLRRQPELPMPISILSLRLNGPGTGSPMSPTGWLMRGPFRIGKLVSRRPSQRARGRRMIDFAASSMIAVGLSWKMAIGACVLGNTLMGFVITINGRMGATVSCVPL